MDCRWPLRSHSGGRKLPSTSSRVMNSRLAHADFYAVVGARGTIPLPCSQGLADRRVRNGCRRGIPRHDLHIDRATRRAAQSFREIGERERHALRLQWRLAWRDTDPIALTEGRFLRRKRETVRGVADEAEATREALDLDRPVISLRLESVEQLTQHFQARPAERLSAVGNRLDERFVFTDKPLTGT